MKKFSPAKTILVFFLSVIAIGTIILSLPFCHYEYSPDTFLTNLFTATSATCVTGLTVVDIGKFYTHAGQVVILLLIQIGGLGYMTLSTTLGLFLGKISLKDRLTIGEILEIDSYAAMFSLLKYILAVVFTIEAVGAVILTIAFHQHGAGLLTSIYHGIFHSISAFCNAGFSLFSDNLCGYQNNALVLGTVALLIIVGGLGFLVLSEIRQRIQRIRTKFSLHFRIVTITTTILVIGGMVIFYLLEFNNTLSGHNFGFSLLNSFFQAVTPRTAGFNSLPINLMHPATWLLLIVLMFIGASPGGTGGGIKTSTFAITMLYLNNYIRQKKDCIVSGRKIPDETITKALIIFILSLLSIAIATTLLIAAEKHFSFLQLLFEVTSAFGTVGLSTGITPNLSELSRIIIILTMLIGRIGPLTFFLALLSAKNQQEKKYPEEKVLIG